LIEHRVAGYQGWNTAIRYFDLAYTWKLNDQVLIIPDARVFWSHEYMQNSVPINASLNGGGGPGFVYDTTVPSRDSVFAGVGLSAQLGDRWNAGAYYNVNFGSATSVANMISNNVGFNF
jgi:outer membrane autotransporter protein